jgi:hypothetical protein
MIVRRTASNRRQPPSILLESQSPTAKSFSPFRASGCPAHITIRDPHRPDPWHTDQLTAEGIPQLARIVAVADAFDAMASVFRARDDVRDTVRRPKGETSEDRAAIQFP